MEIAARLREAVSHLSNNYVLPHLHPAMVAQWILESDRGFSKLATEQNNLAGMKWRRELESVAKPRLIDVPSEPGPVEFADFASPKDFVKGFYIFLDRSPYAGWRTKETPEAYIEHIGKTWATDPVYIEKVKALIPEAQKLIESVKESLVSDPSWFRLYQFNNCNVIGYDSSGKAVIRHVCDTTEALAKLESIYGKHNVHAAKVEHYEQGMPDLPISDLEPTYQKPGTSEPVAKPAVIRKPTPNQSSRNGVTIKRIVLHYTTSSSASGTIAWFAHPASRVSAHYMVGRDGELWQFVSDDKKAWHSGGNNSDTIGIENVALPGQKLTSAQERKLIEICKWLMAEYKISPENVTAHKWLPYSTSCPGSLWATEAELKKWVQDNLA